MSLLLLKHADFIIIKFRIMSINPLNGGLQWLEYDAQGKAVGAKKQKNETGATGFNARDINEFFQPQESKLSNEERFQLVKGVGEEINEESELRTLIENNKSFRCYDGFEPSGRMHIA